MARFLFKGIIIGGYQMKNVSEIFASKVFNDKVMRERLPKETYKILKNTVFGGAQIQKEIADTVANAMKDWAIEQGATHFTHWFQPMTGVTAEKHDSFISPTKEGSIIMEFSGKELVKGEPDASSFPSGGLRATFEARGYTAWDPTSYAFVKDGTLYIPTIFCSYKGNILDKKAPLLRSMQALNTQALRILKLFGNNAKRVITTVGPEQEYFLIDRKMYNKRPDLIYCGRTLLGARPPKGQELEDHYFGAIKPRISAFMADLDEELWKLGVFAKTKHNEVAPSQHELAPVFATTNIATDHNQITMETMKNLAIKHNLACLLHEKPFTGINGSGKHNNWSMSTDNGTNLLEPGKTPNENAQFLLFLTAIIKAVDEYQDLLRISAASAGNDHRLGANEAPPAIVSMFLGEELTDILEAIEKDKKYSPRSVSPIEIGVDVLPHFPKDTTDRNRTSPFAFTGNKFEFRMLGSSASISGTNIILNTIVAEELSKFADILENCEDFTASLNELIKTTIKEHKRIIYNGNNYSEEWVAIAKKRGLLNLKSTVECLPYFTDQKNIDLFTNLGIFSKDEIFARQEILYENYSKVIHIEALTMIDMVKKEIIPAIIKYSNDLSKSIYYKKDLGIDISSSLEKSVLTKISSLSSSLMNKITALEEAVLNTKDMSTPYETANYYHNFVFLAMQTLRGNVDELETLISKEYWPYPSYGQMLFSID